jgi:hypothetical protein
VIGWKYNPKVMKMDSGAIAEELRPDVITKTKYDEDQKGTKTIQSLMIHITFIDVKGINVLLIRLRPVPINR